MKQSYQKNIKPDSDQASDLTIHLQEMQGAGNQIIQQHGDVIIKMQSRSSSPRQIKKFPQQKATRGKKRDGREPKIKERLWRHQQF